MKHILILLTALPVMLFAQDASKLKEVTLPQYVPTKKFLDTVNTVWIDSNDWKKGVRFKAWTDDVVIIEMGTYCMDKGQMARFGGNTNAVNAYTSKQIWEWMQKWGGSITVEVSKAELRGKRLYAGWVYIIRFK